MLNQEGLSCWRPSRSREILRWPLPHQCAVNGALMRAVALLARHAVLWIRGLDHIAVTRDPFILALNHSTRVEAVTVPTLLMLHRGGRLIHFVADWNYSLIPGLRLIYRRAGTVLVTGKSARPAVLNVLKPRFDPPSALERAHAHLAAGRSIGIFPEGRVNRASCRLLEGRRGAALLSLRTGAPVIAAGIRYPGIPADGFIPDTACMEVEIGAPMHLPAVTGRHPTRAELGARHALIMHEIARLSRKSWTSPTEEIHHAEA